MKTIFWVLLGVLFLAVSVISTILIVKLRTKKDEDDVIDKTVDRLSYHSIGVASAIGKECFIRLDSGDLQEVDCHKGDSWGTVYEY